MAKKPMDFTMEDKPMDFTMEDKSMDFTMEDKPMDFTMGDKPMDLSAIDLSRPIDLTTFKRKNCDKDEPPKRIEVIRSQPTDMQIVQYSGISTKTDVRPLPLEFPFETKPMSVSGSLLSPLEIDDRYKKTGDLRMKLASPTASPSMYLPPIIEAPSGTMSWLTSLSLIQSSLSLQSFNTSTRKQTSNERYLSSTRLFNVLAKQLSGNIDCPPRPGQRQRLSHSFSGGTGKKDENESEAAYRERRDRNNIAARRSRDRRKQKCDILLEEYIRCKEGSLVILNEIASLQEDLLKRGYKHPLPHGEDINFMRLVL